MNIFRGWPYQKRSSEQHKKPFEPKIYITAQKSELFKFQKIILWFYIWTSGTSK